jgi:hypothetical protein
VRSPDYHSIVITKAASCHQPKRIKTHDKCHVLQEN